MNFKLYNGVFTLLSIGMMTGVVVAIHQAEALTQEVDIAPSMMITQSSLEEVFNATKTTQDFSSYLSEDLESAKAWFLKPENHPNDGKQKDQHYMKERLTLALLYSANCKENCKLKDADSAWLTSSDHCECVESFNVNNLSGDFTVAGGDHFQMKYLGKLAVSRNELTGVKGLQLLTNLTNLQLRNNTMGEEFVITTNNFPKSIRQLNLKSNGLKIITGLQYLHRLKRLNLSHNEFSGEFRVTKYTFPSSLKKLSLNSNVRVTSINVEDGAVPNLSKLIIDDVSASNGLCDRGILIEPSEICPCKKVESYTSNGSALDNITESFVQNQNFSSYCQDDFDIAKEWFLNATNHPTDLPTDDDEYNNYIIERLILALIYSANCKDNCTLPTNDDWLSATDHSGASPNLTYLDLSGNKLNGFVGGGSLTNLRTLSLDRNEFAGDLIVTGENFPTSIKNLRLSKNKLTSFVNGGILTNLEFLWLTKNEFGGNLTVKSLMLLYLDENKLTGFSNGNVLSNLEILNLAKNEFAGNFTVDGKNLPTSLNTLWLSGNKLTGFSNGNILTNLRYLHLSEIEFEGDFIVDEETFPKSLYLLSLDGNKLTGFFDGGNLTNLQYLSLDRNEFEGNFTVKEKNLPISLKDLSLGGNKLKGFIDGRILTNLKELRLSNNEFEGDYIITAKNIPDSIRFLNFKRNTGPTGLTSIDAESNAVPKLRQLRLFKEDEVGFTVKKGLCNRSGLSIMPPNACE